MKKRLHPDDGPHCASHLEQLTVLANRLNKAKSTLHAKQAALLKLASEWESIGAGDERYAVLSFCAQQVRDIVTNNPEENE